MGLREMAVLTNTSATILQLSAGTKRYCDWRRASTHLEKRFLQSLANVCCIVASQLRRRRQIEAAARYVVGHGKASVGTRRLVHWKLVAGIEEGAGLDAILAQPVHHRV